MTAEGHLHGGDGRMRRTIAVGDVVHLLPDPVDGSGRAAVLSAPADSGA